MKDTMMASSSRDDSEQRTSSDAEMIAIDNEPKAHASRMNEERNVQEPSESRDDVGATDTTRASQASDGEERQGAATKIATKGTSKPSRNRTTSKSKARGPQGSFQPHMMTQGVVGYRPPHQVPATMHGANGPHGSYPLHHYGYPMSGGPHDPYRGPPQHHPQYSMPPLPHHQQAAAYRHVAPGAASFHPGQHLHPSYGPGPYPPTHPYPYHAMHHQHNFQQPTASSSEDTGSIGSTKSKGSKSSKSKGSSPGSKNSHKKRTIDGVNGQKNVNAPPPQQSLASAFTFRRTSSIASTSSTITAGNNTSTETPTLTEDSPQKARHLPPLSTRPDLHGSVSMLDDSRKGSHRRDVSGASTASSLSVGGLSLSSYDTRGNGSIDSIMRKDGGPLVRSSPKRRRGDDGGTVLNGVPQLAMGRSQRRSMKDDESMSDHRENLFLTLSTSPINSDVEATPVSKNTMKSKNVTSMSTKGGHPGDQVIPPSRSLDSFDRASDTPTPPLPKGTADSDMMTDEQLLNRHLRGQSFTPLPHIGQYSESRESSSSPPGLTMNASFATLGGQLSWDITGDAPSLGDLADWEDVPRSDGRRPGSAASGVSPAKFAVWKEGETIPSSHYPLSAGDIRLSALSPHSDADMEDNGAPLPVFFDHYERENGQQQQPSTLTRQQPSVHPGQTQFGDPEHIHRLFMTNGGRGSSMKTTQKMPMHWNPPGQPKNGPSASHMHFPPTPVFASSDKSPHNAPGNFFSSGSMLGSHNRIVGLDNDRIRNLRGRAPAGSQRVPMSHHPLASHITSSHPHNLTSPIGVSQAGKGGLWSPGGGMTSLHSPHGNTGMDSKSPSKRKCVPMKPPIPTKFQGDLDKYKTAHVPEFTSLVNFPANMSTSKQAISNLPEGMRCCVMCGQACPCSNVNKCKKKPTSKADGSLAARNGNVPKAPESPTSAIIPTQNKGLCTLCDVNVWIVATSGLEIKWCKGCKNFRPWAAFGDKGLATKCLRCRDRQREKYAIQKEEKERTRMMKKVSKA